MTTKSPSSPTVLLTGATGFLGFNILKEALARDYNVRIVVRSEEKAASLKSNKTLVALNKSDAYTFIVVPDLFSSGALDEAATGTDYIIHAAAPLPWNTVPEADRHNEVVVPSINGIISVLETASRISSVRRVVYTTSVVALVPASILFGPAPSTKLWTSDDRIPTPEAPYTTMGAAYVASKSAALQAAEEWMAAHRESSTFDLVSLAPPFIIGRNDLLDTSQALETNTSNAKWFDVLKGQRGDETVPSSAIAVEDAALLHVLACDVEKVAGNQVVLFTAAPFEWDDIARIAAERFPGAVEKGWIKTGGGLGTKTLDVDSARAEKVFGVRLRGVGDLVQSLVGQWVEVLQKEEEEEGAAVKA